MNMTDSQIAAFETWYMSKHKKLPTCPAEWAFLKSENGRYVNQLTQTWFEIYQAALESPEVQALRKDAERMNWLEKHFTDVSGVYKDSLGSVQWFYVDCEEVSFNNGDCDMIREAIDAAMENHK